jgi:hypothetical protein
MRFLIYFFGILILLLVSWLYFRSRVKKALMAVKGWIEENNYNISSIQTRWLRRGRVFLTSSPLHVVFRSRITDSNSNEKWCWIRVGTYFRGLANPRYRVFWDTDKD